MRLSFFPESQVTLFRGIFLTGLLLGGMSEAEAQRADPLVWNFVNNYASGSTYNGENWSNDDIWLMWAQSSSVQNPGNTFTASYGDGTAIALSEFSGQQSQAVQLSSYGNASSGMNLTYVNSATLYIGFSKTGNPFSTTAAPAFQNAPFSFMQVEITSTGAQADVADLTAINYFSFPLSLESYKAGGATPANRLQYSGFGSNTASQITSALKNTYTGTAPEILDGNSQLVRVLGPSSTYTLGAGGAAPYGTGGYATFQNYLGVLYNQQTAAENPHTLKLSYTGNNGYTADATITKDGDGNYGVTIENVVANTNNGTNSAVTGKIVINPDTPGNSPTSVTLYSGVLYPDAGTATGDLAAGGAYEGLVNTLLASLSASLVTGAAGSTTPFPGDGSTPPLNEYLFQDSNTWFTQNSPSDPTDPGLFFNDLQTQAYYDAYFKVISEMSDYSLYGSPYADRFSNWNVALNATAYGTNEQPYSEWTPVESMTITIGTVPEPTTWALLGIGLLVVGYGARRKIKT